MQDLADIYTRRGTPLILVFSRVAFTGYFIFALWTIQSKFFIHSELTLIWLLYLLVLYFIAERLYKKFFQKGIDLTFAFPLLFSVYVLHIVSILLAGQARLPIMNRAEHFASFVLICYVVWIFFIKYLPHEVWHEHPYYTAILVFSVTATLGVGNELVELILDSLFNTRLIGDKLDTSIDLLMNALGSGIFLSVKLILGTTEHKVTAT
jgi:hypothetical protein